MSTNGIEAFLRAEEEANQLVEVLTQLRSQTESYRTARQSLDNAGEKLSALTTELTSLAQRVATVTATLQAIGTPELLRGQEAISAEVARLDHDLGEAHQSSSTALAGLTVEVGSLRQEITVLATAISDGAGKISGEVHLLQQAVEILDQRIREHHEESLRLLGTLATAQDLVGFRNDFAQHDDTNRREAHALRNEMAAQTARIETSVRAVRNLVIGAGVLLLVSLVLLAWLLLSVPRG